MVRKGDATDFLETRFVSISSQIYLQRKTDNVHVNTEHVLLTEHFQSKSTRHFRIPFFRSLGYLHSAQAVGQVMHLTSLNFTSL